MAIKETCPKCHTTYELNERLQGCTVRCKKCEGTFVVGGKAPAKAIVAAPPRPRAEPTEIIEEALHVNAPLPHQVQANADTIVESEVAPEPPPAKRRRFPVWLMVLMLLGGTFVLIVAGCGVGGYFFLYRPMSTRPTGYQVSVPNTGAELDRTLFNLKDRNNMRREQAANLLGRTDPTKFEARRGEVCLALEAMFNDFWFSAKDAAKKAYCKWAGKDEIPKLMTLSNDTSFDVRNTALEALARQKDPRAAKSLAERLTNFGERGQAAQALIAMGSAGESEVLKYMHHRDNQTAEEARRILRSYGTKDATLFAQTLADLKSPEFERRASAANWLAREPVSRFDQNTVAKALDPLLLDTNNQVLEGAVRALNVWGNKENVPSVVKFLQNRVTDHLAPDTRRTAMEFLGRQKDERGAEGLILYLGHFEDQYAKRALIAIGPAAEKEVVKIAHHPDNRIRTNARDLLRTYKTKDALIAEQSIEDLKSTDAGRRLGASEWLATAKPDESVRKRVAEALESTITDMDGRISENSLKALVTWGGKDNVPAVVKYLEEANVFRGVRQRQLAIEMLGNSKDERAVLPVIRRLADAQDQAVAVKALQAMGPVAEKEVLKSVEDKDPLVRRVACIILGAIGSKDSVTALENAVKDKDKRVSIAAQAALKQVQSRN